jgi:hypothetical protein
MTHSFSGRRAWEEINSICSLGPRICGTKPLESLRKEIRQRFEGWGGRCREEEFDVSPPSQLGPDVLGVNLIGSVGPADGGRILLGTHYDTRPRADEESSPDRRLQPILGANDGASGVAVLLELGRLLSKQEIPIGIDFVFFDAEEYVFDAEVDPLVLGSIDFAGKLVEPTRYQAAVVVDIVGRAGQILSPDSDSWYLARSLVREFWGVAEARGARSFEENVLYEVLDDHIPMLGVGIPAICLIDVDDPRWHTLDDTPQHCDPRALQEVGEVLWDWICLRMTNHSSDRP